MAQYGVRGYWDDRYSRDTEPFDWYQRYQGIADIIADRFKQTDSILVAGCGNSRLSEEMYLSGWKEITNIDWSEVVIKQMKDKYVDSPGMTYLKMDCGALDFGAGYFDGVIDKALLDSLLCGEGSTNNVGKYLREISRVLKPNGTFLVVSYGAPDHRTNHLDKPEYGWSIDVTTVKKPSIGTVHPGPDDTNVHYVYTMRKGRAKKK